MCMGYFYSPQQAIRKERVEGELLSEEFPLPWVNAPSRLLAESSRGGRLGSRAEAEAHAGTRGTLDLGVSA